MAWFARFDHIIRMSHSLEFIYEVCKKDDPYEGPYKCNNERTGKHDLILLNKEIELLKDLVHELEVFDDITKMLCTNTDYSFNNYLPMKALIEKKLESEEVDDTKNFDSETIKSFREIMRKYWSEFNLPDDTMRLA